VLQNDTNGGKAEGTSRDLRSLDVICKPNVCRVAMERCRGVNGRGRDDTESNLVDG